MKKRKKEKNKNQKQGSDTITVHNLGEVLSYFAGFNSQPVILMTGTKPVPLNEAARKN